MTPHTRNLLAWTLLALSAICLIVRLVAVVEPLGIDQGLWASAVYGMSRGQQLYVDVWEQRPPGIYVTYLAAFEIFGWDAGTLVKLEVVAAALTTALLWLIGRRLAGHLTGAVAAFMFAAFTMPAGLFARGGFLERAICETFIVAAVGLAALAATHLREGASGRWAAVLGLSGGVAAIYKPNAVLYLPAIAAWAALAASKTLPLARLVRLGAVVAVSATAPVVITMIWLWSNGAIGEARVAVVDFNRFYVAEGLGTPAHFMALARGFDVRIRTDAVWLAGAIASLVVVWQLARTRRTAPLSGLALVWGVACVFVIFVNGARLFNSYFVQAYPPLCLMAAWLISGDDRQPRSRLMTLVSATTVALVAALVATGSYVPRLTARTAQDWQAVRGTTARTDYLDAFGGYANNSGYSGRANEELAGYIKARTAPDDRIFLFGVNAADVYFLAERLPAQRFLRVNFFYPAAFPRAEFTVDAVAAELGRTKPRYVIFENLHARSAIGRAVSNVGQEPAVLALLSSYTFETQIEDFALYRLDVP